MRNILFFIIIFSLKVQAQSDTAIFSSTEISDKFYNISEVKPPQVKKYKKEYTHEELKEKYESFMESKYLKKLNFIGYEIAPKRYYIGFSFEIDTTGKISNFKDLVVSNSNYEQELNNKASDGKNFILPALHNDRSVSLKDTTELFGWKKTIVRRKTIRVQEMNEIK